MTNATERKNHRTTAKNKVEKKVFAKSEEKREARS